MSDSNDNNLAGQTQLQQQQACMTAEERRSAAQELHLQFHELLHDNRRLIVVACCLVVFMWLVAEVGEGGLNKIDAAAYWLFVENLRFSWLTPIMEGFSAIATPVTLLVMLLCIAAFAPGRRPGWCCACNLALVVVLNQVLKFIIQRPRPDGFRLVDVSGYSFPSGHSMVSMAFFGLLIWLVWKYEPDIRKRKLICISLAAVIVMMGISRIYLGVHYATDVLAGFCMSIIWLALYTRLIVPLFLGDEDKLVEDGNVDKRTEGKAL